MYGSKVSMPLPFFRTLASTLIVMGNDYKIENHSACLSHDLRNLGQRVDVACDIYQQGLDLQEYLKTPRQNVQMENGYRAVMVVLRDMVDRLKHKSISTGENLLIDEFENLISQTWNAGGGARQRVKRALNSFDIAFALGSNMIVASTVKTFRENDRNTNPLTVSNVRTVMGTSANDTMAIGIDWSGIGNDYGEMIIGSATGAINWNTVYEDENEAWHFVLPDQMASARLYLLYDAVGHTFFMQRLGLQRHHDDIYFRVNNHKGSRAVRLQQSRYSYVPGLVGFYTRNVASVQITMRNIDPVREATFSINLVPPVRFSTG